MVLTKMELVESLRHEVRVLLHLASKIDQSMLDYRPTPKQRSTLELLQYLAIMGPTQVGVIQAGSFNRPALAKAWGAAEEQSKAMNFEAAVAAIKDQSEGYLAALSTWSEADLREEIDMFGRMATRGYLLVNLVLSAHAAYRTQLFLYLKACGREELGTMNLWAGVDG